MNESEVQLEAMRNNITVREHCALCGYWEKFAHIPYWVVVADELGRQVVCPDCIKKYQPVLLEVVEMANKGFWLQYELGNKIQETKSQYNDTVPF